MEIELISSNKSFGGWNKRYKHASFVNNCSMTFAVYLPPKAFETKVPALYWLSGLTCTDVNFMQKAGAQRVASELGIALVVPDTSPRGDNIPDDEGGAYDLGHGAGFYVNAIQEPWKKNYQMYDYIVSELPELIESSQPVSDLRAISGHSMGGHGALTIGIKNIELYRSISAFSPIANPMQCPWGVKAFTHYLGGDKDLWKEYDSCELLLKYKDMKVSPILIDQGEEDQFLKEQLKPENLVKTAKKSKHFIEVNFRSGYDHSYDFVATFIEEHLRFHARFLY